MDMTTAVLELARRGVTIRVEPVSVPGEQAVAGWRIARQSTHGAEYAVLAVVPEVEGRVVCANRSPNE